MFNETVRLSATRLLYYVGGVGCAAIVIGKDTADNPVFHLHWYKRNRHKCPIIVPIWEGYQVIIHEGVEKRK